MPRFAIQCMVATYDQALVIVEAENLEAACVKGIEKARTQGDWEGLEIYGNTFVDGAVVSPSDDPLDDIYNGSLDIPVRYSEDGIGRDWT